MIPLIGYVDRLSARPGETIEVKVSSAIPGEYAADLVRIVHADPNPAGPGMKFVEVSSNFAGSYTGRFQPTDIGSYGVVSGEIGMPEKGVVSVLVRPTMVDRAQPVLSIGMLTLSAFGEGARLSLNGQLVCRIEAPMLRNRWYELRIEVDGGLVTLRQTPLRPAWEVSDQGIATGKISSGVSGRLLIAADHEGARFDGRIENPKILGANGEIIASWDFSVGIQSDWFEDHGPSGLDGRLINLPTRGMRGAKWTGTEMNYRDAPSEYAAIHFHSDDLYDARWQTDFVFEVPKGMKSGVYGIRLRTEKHQDIIPVWVLPPRGQTQSRVAFLASTLTYQAYANHKRGNLDGAFRERVREWGAISVHPDDHADFGYSTYNRHPDGSGVSLSSLRRPVMTLRPGFLTYHDKRGSGLRHFSADSHLTDWLEVTGHDFDVITDHDLHREGVALLKPYKVVLTGSHPEYHTPQTLNGLQDYVNGGGRLVYLGGNGFYWRVALSDRIPDVLEVRRTEGGIRVWDAQPGEYYHQLDGGYGGLWRRNGRPPQMLTGVGFSGQGEFEGSYYARTRASYDPAFAWAFKDIIDEKIGDFGLSGGGAAGYEIDRADVDLGTPNKAVVLASSKEHQDHFYVVFEELLGEDTDTVNGEPPEKLIRADMTYFETPGGGKVFSVGSITFCGSLSHNNYDNSVSILLRNVLNAFTS